MSIATDKLSSALINRLPSTMSDDEPRNGLKFADEEPSKQIVTSNPMKRLRWATQRASADKGNRKRQSILDRLHKRTPSGGNKRDSNGTVSEGSDSLDDEKDAVDTAPSRTVYFNVPLPASARDEEGVPLAQYPRNKIRTAKYTALSFVPKDIYYQFRNNIANSYFFFIIILSVSL